MIAELDKYLLKATTRNVNGQRLPFVADEKMNLRGQEGEVSLLDVARIKGMESSIMQTFQHTPSQMHCLESHAHLQHSSDSFHVIWFLQNRQVTPPELSFEMSL